MDDRREPVPAHRLEAVAPSLDIGGGVLLALVIGVPGLGLYLAAVRLEPRRQGAASGLDPHWYAIPVLVLSALRAALQEEVIVVGFLFARLDDLRWRPWACSRDERLLRGSYHLYQGFGGFVGNAVMGVVFGLVYLPVRPHRTPGRRHSILDFVSFVGYDLLKSLAPGLLP